MEEFLARKDGTVEKDMLKVRMVSCPKTRAFGGGDFHPGSALYVLDNHPRRFCQPTTPSNTDQR
jgi:hypothetical protein